MKHRFLAALAAVFAISAMLPAAGCTWDQFQNKVEAAITATNEVIVANQATMKKVCAAGQAAHDLFVANIQNGVIIVSAADQADEATAYQAGLNVCSNLPTDLASLLKDIPAIQEYINRVMAVVQPG